MRTIAKRERAHKFDAVKYGKILQSVRPHNIENNTDYQLSCAQIGRLIDAGNRKTVEETMLLKLLVTLAEEYERKHYSLSGRRVSPLEVLQYLMEEHKHTAKDLWPIVGDKGLVSRILHKKRSISKRIAEQLAAFYHVSPAVFIFDSP